MLIAYGVTHPGEVRPSTRTRCIWDFPPACSSSPTAWAVTRRAKSPRAWPSKPSARSSRAAGATGISPGRSASIRPCRSTAIVSSPPCGWRTAGVPGGRGAAGLRGHGTTIVAALIEQQRLTFCGVGDSRLYSVRRRALDAADARRFMGGHRPRARSPASTRPRWRITRCVTCSRTSSALATRPRSK